MLWLLQVIVGRDWRLAGIRLHLTRRLLRLRFDPEFGPYGLVGTGKNLRAARSGGRMLALMSKVGVIAGP
jgi:hypothetical protein